MAQHDIELQERLSLPDMRSSIETSNDSDQVSQPRPSYASHRSSQYRRASQAAEDEAQSLIPPVSHQGSSHTNQNTQYASGYRSDLHIPVNQQHMGKPKKVLETSWLRFFQTWPVHALAISSTVGITYVGSRHRFWYPEDGSFALRRQWSHDDMSIPLQLTAKVHEIVIVFSLSAMALSMFRRRLVGDGVRLGFLTGCYRVGDLNYLISSSFWRQGLDRDRPWEVLLCGFLVFATLMSTVVGPVSAVLLIPALDWFEYESGTAFSNITSPIIYRVERDRAWPTVMTAENDPMRIGRCVNGYGIYMSLCPAAGFRELNEWVKDWAATGLNNSLTFQSTTADIVRRLRHTQTAEKPSVVLSTTPSEFLMHSIGLFQNYIPGGEVGDISGKGKPQYRLNTKGATDSSYPSSAKLFQPLVQSTCKMYDKDIFKEPNFTAVYPTNELNCMGDEDCRDRQQNPRNLKLNGSIFEDERGEGGNVIITSYFLHDNVSSPVVHLAGQFPEASVGRPNHNVFLCNMVASWIPAEFNITQVESDELMSSLSSNESMRNALQGARPEVEFSKSPVAGGDSDAAAEGFLAKVFGAYLTEALARVSMGYDTVVKRHPNENGLVYANLNYQHHPDLAMNSITKVNESYVHVDETKETLHMSLDYCDKHYFESWLPIALEAERYGYGTGKNNKTLHFAQAIMGIYLGIVALYVAAITVGHLLEFCRVPWRSGHPISVVNVAAWPDQQELVILALKTPAPDGLPDAGAGVTSTKTWEKVVQARADEQARVQLVLRDKEKAPRLRKVGSGLYY
ncbi:hypothetical protein PG996_008321 [Apiospora saccharicola]|uniref:Uncharacterized protein n=1 Tax=Apiospora saccharicola TaxID=335842 RepID=A0ABR1UXK5_9PEZI